MLEKTYNPREVEERLYRAWEESGATGIRLRTDQPEAMELMAELTGAARRVSG